MRSLPAFALAAGALLAPTGVMAAPILYHADLTELNNSGVSGGVDLSLDGSLLQVSVMASGLEADMPHVQHIHGRLDGSGMPEDSLTPPPTADTDGDGYVELAEGLLFYGPIIVPLSSPPGGAMADFPTAPGGIVNFMETYDLADSSIYAAGFSQDDVLPLDLREFVIHGMTVAPGIGAGTPGEVDGTGGYLATLPVASGEFVLQAAAVPEPMTFGLMAAGLLGVGLFGTRRRPARG